MILVVCFKLVPDTQARPQVGPDGKSINPQGIDWMISAYDRFALDTAMQLKEKTPGAQVIGICLDPGRSDVLLRRVLAIGADKVIHLKGEAGFDGAATAEILAGAIKPLNPSIVFFGRQAIDTDAGQVPALVAHRLGRPRANVVTKLEVADGKAIARRQIEGSEEVVEMALPCVVSAQKGINGINDWKDPTMKGIMASKNKPLEAVAAPAAAARMEVVKMEAPPSRPSGRIVGKGKDAVKELVRLLREEAKVL